MPALSIYVNDEIYAYLLKMGRPSTVGKAWIAKEYVKRTTQVQEPAEQENENVP